MNTVKKAKPLEFEIVDDLEATCDGGKMSGHPRVYLSIERHKGEIACPYCSKTFIYRYRRIDWPEF